MKFSYVPIALTLVPSVAFTITAMWHLCDLTKFHKRSWIGAGVLAFLFALAGTFQAAALGWSTPVDFVSFGAFYSPATLWDEPWRFVSMVFLYEDPVIVLLTTVTIAIVGCRLSQHVGFRGMLFTFASTSIAGTLLTASADPQALVMGATSGTFGIVFATLFIGGWRASQYVERVARITAISFVAVCVARFSATQNSAAALASAGGAGSAIFIWLATRQPSHTRRRFAMATTFAALAASTIFIPPATNLIGPATLTKKMERETWGRLASLENARANASIGDGEFAMRLSTDVIEPLEGVIQSSASWSGGRSNWIVIEHERLLDAHEKLSALREIFSLKQRLVEAEAAADEESRVKKLDEFWNSLPAAARACVAFDVDREVREGIDFDLAMMKRTANDIEIWNLETALVALREQVIEDGPRTPASTLPWKDIREKWLERRTRLERILPDGTDQTTRVEALKERLARAIEAIE